MDSPQNGIWGPHLWTILHSLAERIGQPHLKKLQAEETRLWTGLLGSLRYSLPCPLCKKHFTNFYSNHSVSLISTDFIRNWLYECHNNVNTINSKINILSIEEIKSIYSKPFNFSYHYGVVLEHMTRSIRLGWCSREDIGRTNRFFQEIKRFYDLF